MQRNIFFIQNREMQDTINKIFDEIKTVVEINNKKSITNQIISFYYILNDIVDKFVNIA